MVRARQHLVRLGEPGLAGSGGSHPAHGHRGSSENKQDTGDANTTANWKPGGQIIRYRPIIEYQWQVNGGIYERSRIHFSAAKANEGTREAAEAIIAPYPVGSAVDIHYDPSKPSRGILQPGAHWDGLGVTLIAALVFGAIALVFSVMAFRSLRK